MAFLDPKEEVIKFELTQHGKYLLSKGKFKPVYYSFSDDDILYDASYADFQEAQNTIENRINETTVYVEPLYVGKGIETRFNEESTIARQNELIPFQSAHDKNNLTRYLLNNADVGSTYKPSFDIAAFKGDFESTILNVVSSSGHVIITPKMDSTLEYRILRGDFTTDAVPEQDTATMTDGTEIRVQEEILVLDLKERNTEFKKENFEIEVFEILSGANEEERLLPLYFAPNNTISSVENPTYADHFFEILVDNELPESILKEIRGKSRSIFVRAALGDVEQETFKSSDIYRTSEDGTTIEDCD